MTEAERGKLATEVPSWFSLPLLRSWIQGEQEMLTTHPSAGSSSAGSSHHNASSASSAGSGSASSAAASSGSSAGSGSASVAEVVPPTLPRQAHAGSELEADVLASGVRLSTYKLQGRDCFMREKRSEFKAAAQLVEGPIILEKKLREIGHEAWRSLTDAERAPYCALANRGSQRFRDSTTGCYRSVESSTDDVTLLSALF